MWEAPPTPHRLRRQKAKGTEVVMGVGVEGLGSLMPEARDKGTGKGVLCCCKDPGAQSRGGGKGVT